jgi:hypothetical protein
MNVYLSAAPITARSQTRSRMIFDSDSQSNDILLKVISLVQPTFFDLPLATMDLPPAWSQTCVCGRAFSLPQAYTFHQRSCQRTKKRLLGALEKAKGILQARKRRKVESVPPAQNPAEAGPSSQLVDLAHPCFLFQSAAQTIAAEAGPSSQMVDLAHPNDLPTPVVHSEPEVRFLFNQVHHILTFPISERHGYCRGL